MKSRSSIMKVEQAAEKWERFNKDIQNIEHEQLFILDGRPYIVYPATKWDIERHVNGYVMD